MDIAILGALEVSDGRSPVDLGARPGRAVIEALALDAGNTVTTAHLVDAVWGEEPPPSAAKTLQSHISRLRHVLPPGLIETADGGYRLTVRPDEVDAHRLEALVDDARHARSTGDDRLAATLLDDAVTLWRSTPLDDLADGAFRTGQLARLEAVYESAVDERIAAHLAIGDHERMVPELELLVADHPYREPLWGHLMLALHRSGRRADALAAYGRLRLVLRDDLGISPSAPLRQLESLIIDEDPSLELAPPLPVSNLPTPLTSFVGRSQQLRDVTELLDQQRLVTLVGPGGVGKTRLAIETARAIVAGRSIPWADGIVFVDLSGMSDIGDVVAGVREQLVETLEIEPSTANDADGLAASLSDRSVLLVLDRAEVLAAPLGDLLRTVLERAPGITALVTSRVPLSVPGEQRYDVPTLELPGHDEVDGGEAHASEAVELFLERIRDPDIRNDDRELAAVVELCRSVDGLPLAIELLAPHVGALSASSLLAEFRTDARTALGSVRHDSGDPHASLEAVLDSSAELLTPQQQRALGRLTVFRGSFDLAAVRALGVDVLGEFEPLTAIGLVTPADQASAERRFRLTDSTRGYATRFLDDDDAIAAARAHALHYAAFMRRAGAGLSGPNNPTWTRRINREASNLRTALSWLLDNDPAAALAFPRAMDREQYVWSDQAEAVRVLDRLIDVAQHDMTVAPVDVAWALLGISWPRFLTGDVDGGLEAIDGAIARFVDAGERFGASEALVSRAHMELLGTGDGERAAVWYERALDEARALDDPQLSSLVLVEAAQSLILSDRLDERIEMMLEEAEGPLRAAHDHQRLAHLYMDRMIAAYATGDLDGAGRFADLTIAEDRLAHMRMFSQIAYAGRGVRKLHLDDRGDALSDLHTAIRLAHDDHNSLQLGIALQALAVHHTLAGHDADAARIWAAARSVSPLWPVFERRYGELIGRGSMERLEAAFASATSAGTVVPLDELVEWILG